MTEQEALQHFIAPGQPRHKAMGGGGVMQIHVTRACTLACRNCTQGSNLRGKNTFMSPGQFRQAIESLEGYPFLMALFGGQPTISPWFADYCRILQELVPKGKRGLWTNALNGYGPICRETFLPQNCNLNAHQNQAAIDEFRRDWPEANVVGIDQDSRHAPVFVALKDIIPNESMRWQLISQCDVMLRWSAMIGLFRGQLRAWICEIMGAQSILHQDDPNYLDTGLDPTKLYEYPGQVSDYQNSTRTSAVRWWQLPVHAFAHQVCKHCHECGVPLKGYGTLSQDNEGTDQVSTCHASIYKPKRKDHRLELVTELQQLGTGRLPTFIDYLGNASK